MPCLSFWVVGETEGEGSAPWSGIGVAGKDAGHKGPSLAHCRRDRRGSVTGGAPSGHQRSGGFFNPSVAATLRAVRTVIDGGIAAGSAEALDSGRGEGHYRA